MNQIRPRVFIVFCCLTITLVSLVSGIIAVVFLRSSRMIRVRTDFATIQEAINNANAGDTIQVSAGTYSEHIIVNKTVSLAGESSDNTIIDGSNNGTIIQVVADNVLVTGFRLQNSGYGWTMHGVYVHGADGCTIRGNVLYNTCHSIRLNYSRNSEVVDNTIDGPSSGVAMYGIRLENSINCTAEDNKVSVRVGAIHLENATSCLVKGNYVTRNDQGIRLYSPCTYNAIVENTIYSNNYDGMISLMPGNATLIGNRIFHNNFVNNTQPFVTQSSNTSWDNGLEGNYWSRYQGTDLNNDGVGDTPCAVGVEKDNYPLMGPFYTFNAFPRLNVNVISDCILEDFSFSAANVTIRIKVSNATVDQTWGFCRIAIPHVLMDGTYRVTVDGAEPSFVNYTLYDDGDARWMYFNYQLSQREVMIFLESSLSPAKATPLSTIVALLVAAVAALVIVSGLHYRRKRKLMNSIRKR